MLRRGRNEKNGSLVRHKTEKLNITVACSKTGEMTLNVILFEQSRNHVIDEQLNAVATSEQYYDSVVKN